MVWWIFQNVVVTSVLVVAVLMVCRMWRLGPVARHALWLLVLVKFVTPPIVVWPWAAPDPLGLASFDPGTQGSPPQAAAIVDEESAPSPELDGSAAESARRPWSDSSPAEALAPDAGRQDPVRAGAVAWPWLLGVWAAGSMCLALVEGLRWLRLKRRTSHALPGDPAIVVRMATLAAEMGLKPVRVLSVPGGGSPFVWSVGQPMLVWPAELAADSLAPLSDTCIDGLLVHELAHIKRRDHLIGWIELAASIIWWWNPLFWFVRSALREQAELACDAWVISALPHGRRAYAESLLALSAIAVQRTPVMAIGVRARTRRALERRLVMIMKDRAPLHLPTTGLLTLALLAAATLPTWATGSQPQAAQPSPMAVAAPRPKPAAVRPAPVAPSAEVPPLGRRSRAQMSAPVTVRPTLVPPPAMSTVAAPDLPVGTAPPRQVTPAPPPPRPMPVRRSTTEKRAYVRLKPVPLPAEGQQLLEAFEVDTDEIQREAERKTESRREALLKELQALQDKYTKAAQLDEAIAIRDFLRAGMQGKFSRKGLAITKR